VAVNCRSNIDASSMAVQKLPNSCATQLSSGQAILDPCAFVKELVENAIDAGANSISTEVSANVIDSIQIRDNGSGINPDDRLLIGRRYCTSKIRDISELKTVGGTSLGFRGEALSSMVDLAEQVEVTTKVEGEAVAVKIILQRFVPQSR